MHEARQEVLSMHDGKVLDFCLFAAYPKEHDVPSDLHCFSHSVRAYTATKAISNWTLHRTGNAFHVGGVNETQPRTEQKCNAESRCCT